MKTNQTNQKKRKTANKHPCDGCVWRAYVSEDKMMCMFPSCVRAENQTGQKGNAHGKQKDH